MKKERVPASVIGFLFILISLSPFIAKAQYDDVSLETFYEELSPYGVWIEDPQYGRVWRPDVDQDEFRPYYSDGHWEMTKYGNTWVSDYEWGWAPFHYGRWSHSSRRGWVWIPDVHWGPAWVSWRSGGGYYGWAPMGPGMNINIGRIPDLWWVFIPQRHIYYDRYPRYDYRRNRNIYHNTVIINNTYVYNRNKYYTGPRAYDIQRITRQPVKIHDVRDNRPTYAGRSSRPDSDGRSGSLVQSPRPQRSSVSTDTRSGASTQTTRSTGSVNPVSGRSGSTTQQRATRTTEVARDERSTQTVERSARPAIVDRQPAVRSNPTQIQGSDRSSSSTQRVERTATPQRTQSAPVQAPQRTQQSRPSQSSSNNRSTAQPTQRTEVRQAPSSSRQSSEGSSSTPSGRSAERSSTSSRPSRGN